MGGTPASNMTHPRQEQLPNALTRHTRQVRSADFPRGRVRILNVPVSVVDLFSGPGGLAEGFAGYRDEGGRARFEIALSVEKERSAHRTLLLRAFLRKFGDAYPSCYYTFLNDAGDEPNWAELYPAQWEAAVEETPRLEIGTKSANQVIDGRIREIRERSGDATVLLGGPPCQSYSLVGRARNTKNTDYDPSKDGRLFLYQEYVRVMKALRPAVAIMENVKGILSAQVGDRPIIDDIVKSLRSAAGPDSYRLIAVAGPEACLWEDDRPPRDFLVHTEDFGIPQARHRVIVVCVRRDICRTLEVSEFLQLEEHDRRVGVNDVIGGILPLRSRISRGDSHTAWRGVVHSACERIGSLPEAWMSSCFDQDEAARFREIISQTRKCLRERRLTWKGGSGGTEMHGPKGLSAWTRDPKLTRLPNQETRGHMPADIERYLFASAFAEVKGMSPRAATFPDILAPNHANWQSGKFSDRFRVQLRNRPSSTITSHISKDGHYYIHPDPTQCRSLTVREAARLQTFPDNYLFKGGRTQQYVQVGNAVPPYIARQIAERVCDMLDEYVTVQTLTKIGGAPTGSSEPSKERSSQVLAELVA